MSFGYISSPRKTLNLVPLISFSIFSLLQFFTPSSTKFDVFLKKIGELLRIGMIIEDLSSKRMRVVIVAIELGFMDKHNFITSNLFLLEFTFKSIYK